MSAHPGAGASTVALAVATAMAEAGTPTRLVECGHPWSSGLVAVTQTELGCTSDGVWRRGRRDGIEVDRLWRSVDRLDAVPLPPQPARADEAVVFDLGWTAREVLSCEGWVRGLLEASRLLVVCRATVPGVRQTELLLAATVARAATTPVAVAAVGRARWPGVVAATCGPVLARFRDAGRVVTVPLDRGLEVTGATSGPLPKLVTAAGGQLAALLRGPDVPSGSAGGGGAR